MADHSFATTRNITSVKPACFETPGEDGVFTLLKRNVTDKMIDEGGLRLRGQFKENSRSRSLVTVVTVVFNGENLLEETIRSVIEQTYDNVEYIIVDGGSSDHTLDVIKKYDHAIDYWVSEPDGGIYEAMNKAIELASGQWINFMNCGDLFYDNSVLASIFCDQHKNAQIIYGDHEVVYSSGRRRLAKAGDPTRLWKGSQFCHQATFVDTSFHKGNKFNPCEKIVADFEFFYRALLLDARFSYVDVVIARYSAGGVSDTQRIQAILGFWSIVEKNTQSNLYYVFRVLLEVVKGMVKSFAK